MYTQNKYEYVLIKIKAKKFYVNQINNIYLNK